MSNSRFTSGAALVEVLLELRPFNWQFTDWILRSIDNHKRSYYQPLPIGKGT